MIQFLTNSYEIFGFLKHARQNARRYQGHSSSFLIFGIIDETFEVRPMTLKIRPENHPTTQSPKPKKKPSCIKNTRSSSTQPESKTSGLAIEELLTRQQTEMKSYYGRSEAKKKKTKEQAFNSSSDSFTKHECELMNQGSLPESPEGRKTENLGNYIQSKLKKMQNTPVTIDKFSGEGDEKKRSKSEKKQKRLFFEMDKARVETKPQKEAAVKTVKKDKSSEILSLVVRMSGLGAPTAITMLKNSVKSTPSMFQAVHAMFCLLQGAYKRLPLNYQTMQKDWKTMRSLIVPLLISTVLSNIRNHLKTSISSESIQNAKKAVEKYFECLNSGNETIHISPSLYAHAESIVEYVRLAIQLWESYHTSDKDLEQPKKELNNSDKKPKENPKASSRSIGKSSEKKRENKTPSPIKRESSKQPLKERDLNSSLKKRSNSPGNSLKRKNVIQKENPKPDDRKRSFPVVNIDIASPPRTPEKTNKKPLASNGHQNGLRSSDKKVLGSLSQSKDKKLGSTTALGSQVLKFQQELVKLINFRSINSIRKTVKSSPLIISALSSLAYLLAGHDPNIPESLVQIETIEWKDLQEVLKSSKITDSMKEFTVLVVNQKVNPLNKIKAMKEVKKYKEISKKEDKSTSGINGDCENVIKFVEHCGELFEMVRKQEEKDSGSTKKPAKQATSGNKKSLSQTPQKKIEKKPSQAQAPREPSVGTQKAKFFQVLGFGKKIGEKKSMSLKINSTFESNGSSMEKTPESVDMYVMQKLKKVNRETVKKMGNSTKSSFIGGNGNENGAHELTGTPLSKSFRENERKTTFTKVKTPKYYKV